MTTTTASTVSHVPSPSCSICLHPPQDTSRSLIPSCGHTFCAPCVLSWSFIRSACPLCKAAFSSLVVRRHLDGQVVPDGGWIEEPISLLRRASWVRLEQVNDRVADVQGVFVPVRSSTEIATNRNGLPSMQATSASGPATRASRHWEDEEMEEEREKNFWEEEERQWQEQRRGVKLLGNRRYGQNGYVSSGRMVARATARQPASSSAAHPASSSTNGRSKAKRKRKKGSGSSLSGPPAN